MQSPQPLLLHPLADIVCFQETKLSHGDCWPPAFQRMAGVPGWCVSTCSGTLQL